MNPVCIHILIISHLLKSRFASVDFYSLKAKLRLCVDKKKLMLMEVHKIVSIIRKMCLKQCIEDLKNNFFLHKKHPMLMKGHVESTSLKKNTSRVDRQQGREFIIVTDFPIFTTTSLTRHNALLKFGRNLLIKYALYSASEEE